MLNATVRAAATGLPAAIFNRRRMLLGLAAASTAAAGTVSAAPCKLPADETAELLDLGAKTPFALANYRQAIEVRAAIVAEWAPRWPAVPEEIRLDTSLARSATDIEGRHIEIRVWRRDALASSIADCAAFSANRKWRKGTSPERIALRKAKWNAHAAEREAVLRALDAYSAKCERIAEASGIRKAQAAEAAARAALMAHVREVMAFEPATMAGVLVQAEALHALALVPQHFRVVFAQRGFEFSHGDYGERLAASILRIAGNA